jgi:hypothetical protein
VKLAPLGGQRQHVWCTLHPVYVTDTLLLVQDKRYLQLSTFWPLNFPLLAEAENKLDPGKDPK